MGNVLRDQCRFFSIPQEFVESGCLLRVTPSGNKLYTVLCYLAQRHTAVQLEFSNAQLQAFTGLDTKSIQSARRQLCDLSLIKIQKGALGVYTYTLLNPTSSQPLPAPEGRTGFKRYRSPAKEPTTGEIKVNVANTVEHRSPNIANHPGQQVDRPTTFRCYSCEGEDFWSRGTERICARCHPGPGIRGIQGETCSPIAAEVGF
jgi:hypothetical protein